MAIETIISIILCAVAAVGAFITTCFEKNAKKRAAKTQAIIANIPEFIGDIENMFNNFGPVEKSGNLKLDCVLNKIRILCSDMHTKFDEEFYRGEVEKILKAPQATVYKGRDGNGTVRG